MQLHLQEGGEAKARPEGGLNANCGREKECFGEFGRKSERGEFEKIEMDFLSHFTHLNNVSSAPAVA